MSGRLNLKDATILPFQFPKLKDDVGAFQEDAIPALPLPHDNAEVEPTDWPEMPTDDAAPEEETAIAAEFAKAQEEGLQRGFEEGRDTGYAEGFAEGAKAAEAKLAEEVQRLSGIIDKLSAPLTALDSLVEEAVAALALEVARCVIGDEVTRSHDFLVRLVREAIAKVPLDMGAPRVLLNPADLDLVRKLVPEIESDGAMLVADDTIETGGAIVVADGEDRQIKDRRWNTRATDGVSQVNLTLSSRWREVMLTLFDGEEGE